MQQQIEREVAELRQQAAEANVRSCLLKYVTTWARYTSDWLSLQNASRPSAAERPECHRPAFVFLLRLVRYLRALTFHHVEHDVSLHQNVEPSSPTLADIRAMRDSSYWLGEGDLTCVANVLHLRLHVEGHVAQEANGVTQLHNQTLAPAEHWIVNRSHPRADVTIRYVNSETSLRQAGRQNHYVGVMRVQ